MPPMPSPARMARALFDAMAHQSVKTEKMRKDAILMVNYIVFNGTCEYAFNLDNLDLSGFLSEFSSVLCVHSSKKKVRDRLRLFNIPRSTRIVSAYFLSDKQLEKLCF